MIRMLSLAVACTAAGGVVSAAELDPEDRAATLTRQAQEAAAEGRTYDALTALRLAWALSPSFKIACNLGRLEFQRGEMRGAAEFLSLCVHETPKARTPEERARDARAKNALTEALKHVAVLSIDVSEPRADVSVDSNSIGLSPISRVVFVAPGHHLVTAKLEGRALAAVETNAIAGGSSSVWLSLEPPARPTAAQAAPARAPEPKPLASLASTSEPLAPLASTPKPLASLASMSEPLAPLASTPKPLAPLASTSEPLAPRASASEPRKLAPLTNVTPVVAGMGSGAGLALGAGVVFVVLKGSSSAEAKQQARMTQADNGECSTPLCGADSAVSREGTYHDLSIVSFTAAACLAVGAVGVALLGPKHANKRKPAALEAARRMEVATW